MGTRYELRRNDEWSWSVVDKFTDKPAFLDDTMLTDLSMGEADVFADLLNVLDKKRRGESERGLLGEDDKEF